MWPARGLDVESQQVVPVDDPRLGRDRPWGPGQATEYLRIGAEIVLTLDFSGKPPFAQVFRAACAAPAAHVLDDGLDVAALDNLGCHAGARQHLRHAPLRASGEISPKPHDEGAAHDHHEYGQRELEQRRAHGQHLHSKGPSRSAYY